MRMPLKKTPRVTLKLQDSDPGTGSTMRYLLRNRYGETMLFVVDRLTRKACIRPADHLAGHIPLSIGKRYYFAN